MTGQLDRLNKLQHALLGDFADMTALVYACSLALISWLLTSFRTLSQARLPCLLTVLASLACERQASWLEKEHGWSDLVFYSRSLVLLTLAWHLCRSSAAYVDLNLKNHKLIKKVVDESVA